MVKVMDRNVYDILIKNDTMLSYESELAVPRAPVVIPKITTLSEIMKKYNEILEAKKNGKAEVVQICRLCNGDTHIESHCNLLCRESCCSNRPMHSIKNCKQKPYKRCTLCGKINHNTDECYHKCQLECCRDLLHMKINCPNKSRFFYYKF